VIVYLSEFSLSKLNSFHSLLTVQNANILPGAC
jgi:hypothetical protein